MLAGCGVLAAQAVLAQPLTPRLLVDLRTDPQSSSPTGFITFRPAGSPVQGALFFSTPNAVHGNPGLTRSLVFHDGSGARLVASGLDVGAKGLTDLGTGRAVFLMSTNATGTEPWVTDGTANGTRMLLDVTPGSSGTVTGTPPFTLWDGKAYFADGWVTDGTTEGTLNFLAGLPPITRFVLMGGVQDPTGQSPGGWMLFRHVGQLYRTNGGLAELVSQSISPEFFPFGAIRGVPGQPDRIIFGAGLPSPADGWWLWSTDGTAAGTQLIRSFEGNINTVRSGATGMQGSSVGDAVYFFVRNFEIWKTDGTPAGTMQAGYQGFATTAAQPGGPFVRVGSHVVYQAGVNVYRVEAAGSSTRLSNFQADAPVGLVAVGNFAYFAHTDAATGLEPWITDGTPAGTRMLGDLYPGPAGSLDWNVLYPSPIALLPSGRGGLISAQTLGSQSLEKSMFWLHPVTADLVPILSGSVNTGADDVRADVAFVENPGQPAIAIFAAKGPQGTEPWNVQFVESAQMPGVAVPDTSTIAELVDLAPGTLGSAPAQLGKVGRRVMFTGSAGRLGVSDGTSAGTRYLENPAWQAGTSPDEGHRSRAILDRYYFQTSAGNTGVELYMSDGTSAGTRVVADTIPGPSPGYGDWPIAFGESVIFRQFASGSRLWRFEPGASITFPITAPTVQAGFPTPIASIQAHAAAGDAVVVLDGSGRLMRVDGEDHSVSVIRATSGVTADQIGPTFYRAGSLLYFFAQPSGSGTGLEPYVSDGVAGGTGTRLLKDLNPGVGGSRLSGQGSSAAWIFTAVGAHAAFVASPTGSSSQSRLWISDGTEAGTRSLTIPGAGAQAMPQHLCEFNGRLVFSAQGPNLRRLFISDLTDQGTMVVPDGSLGGVTVAGQPISTRGRLFFAGLASFRDETGAAVSSGVEPWISDGTAAGTRMLTDMVPGNQSSSPRNFTAVNSRVFFTATTPLTGEELWMIDLCPGDFDNSGTSDVGDLFAFLTPWFARDTAAEVDGAAGVSVGDLFEFLEHWFAGCDA